MALSPLVLFKLRVQLIISLLLCFLGFIKAETLLAQPDLLIGSGSPTVSPSTVLAGGAVTLSQWTLVNQGTADINSELIFRNGFYLSTDATITSSDTYLTGNANSGLVAGGTFTWGGPTLTIPAGTAPGNYYIGILVDRTNVVTESNEGNNFVSAPLTVALPDLLITSGTPTVTPSTAAAVL